MPKPSPETPAEATVSALFAPYFSENSRSLRVLFDDQKPRRVLDMGTGNGSLAKEWHRRNPNLQILGVDRLEDYRPFWRDPPERLRFECSDLFEIFRDERIRFDAIVFNSPHDIRPRTGMSVIDEIALCDPRLEIADRFFRDAGDFLEDDGFILYTYSDLGEIKLKGLLDRVIEKHNWHCYPQDTFVFPENRANWKSYLLNPPHDDALVLWYNLRITKRPFEPRDARDGFERTIRLIRDHYARRPPTREVYKEAIKDRLIPLFQIVSKAMARAVAFRPTPGDASGPVPDPWCTQVWSYPDWNLDATRSKHSYWSPDKEQLNAKRTAMERFEEILTKYRPDQHGLIELFIDFISSNEDLESVVAVDDEMDHAVYYFMDRHLDLRCTWLKDREGVLRGPALDEQEWQKAEALLNRIVTPSYELVREALTAVKRHTSLNPDYWLRLLRNLYLNVLLLADNDPGQRIFVGVMRLPFPAAKRQSTLITFASYRGEDSAGVRRLHEVTAEVARALVGVVQLLAERGMRHRASTQTARAAIMSRNLSHNVGSHALANPRLHEAIGLLAPRAQQRLGTFHAYAQGRLDFLARAISEVGHRPEPLFFRNDVLAGFFRQGVLLQTLIEDAGFPARRIRFRVEIETVDPATEKPRFGSTEFVAQELDDPEAGDSVSRAPLIFGPDPEQPNLAEDVLLGIPGGMIGVHALYAYLENVMRNAVKYGARRGEFRGDENLVISLRLERCHGYYPSAADEPALEPDTTAPDPQREDAWALSIWDNLSTDPDHGVSRVIRGHINQTLIDGDGRIVHEGHGVQEMKICAELLAGGLQFPSDTTFLDKKSHWVGSLMSQEYAEYLGALPDAAVDPDPSEAVPRIAGAQTLRCYARMDASPEDEPVPGTLVYALLMPIPVLLEVVAPVKSDRTSQIPDHVRYVADVRDLVKNNTHLAVILDRGDGRFMVDTLETVAQHHRELPYRLMVLSRDQPRADAWRAALERYVQRDLVPIPPRRIHIAWDSDLHDRLSEYDAGLVPDFLGAEKWDALVMRVYDCWLRVFKGDPPPWPPVLGRATAPVRGGASPSWLLCLGFERDPDFIREIWKDRLAIYGGKDACVSVHVVAGKDITGQSERSVAVFSDNSPFGPDDGEGLRQSMDEGQKRPLPEKPSLVYDNHGKCFPGVTNTLITVAEAARFSQETGLEVALSLFQSLMDPPATPFCFAFFVYSLAEAALVRVAVLDERVAQATLWGNGYFVPEKMMQFHKAGIFPLYRVRRGEQAVAISSVIEKALSTNRDFGRLQEGVYLDEPAASIRAVILKDGLAAELECRLLGEHEAGPGETVDVLVFHEGVADTLRKHKLPISEDDIRVLYRAVPAVVRTSGRGQHSRHLGNSLPFVEFSELSGNTYRALNKLALVKALLGVTGNQ
jgi:hypothetical protein